MPYIIRDENGEAMRLVRRHEEAKHIINLRDGWTMEYIKTPREKPEDIIKLFERAPF